MKRETPTYRDNAIDMAKGLGILCIVFLHYEVGVIPWQMNVFIGSFMISMFYVTAGWLSADKPSIPTKVLAKKRLRSLGLPYLYWSLIILAFDCILWSFGHYDTYFIGRETFKTLTLRGVGTLWFLPALWFGEVTVNALRRTRLPIIAGIGAIVLILIYYKWYGIQFGRMTTNIEHIINAPFRTLLNACFAIIGVSGGLIAHKILQILNLNRLKQGILSVVLLCVSFYGATYMARDLGVVGEILWPFVCPILGPVGFILLFKALESPRWLRYFDYWGRNSLALMVTHYDIVLVVIAMAIQLALGRSMYGWISIGAFILSMPLQWLIVEALKKYTPRLLGKR